MSKFEPSQLPNLAGQVAIVTGGHSGLFVSLPILQNMLIKSSGLGTTTELLRMELRCTLPPARGTKEKQLFNS